MIETILNFAGFERSVYGVFDSNVLKC